MLYHERFVKAVSITLLAAFIGSLCPPDIILAQTADCQYDRQHPSLEDAEKLMKDLYGFDCAAAEILDVLHQTDTLDHKNYAAAQFLLGQAYWGQIVQRQNPIPDTQMVTNVLIKGFLADSSWGGEWFWNDDVDFLNIAAIARANADSIRAIPPDKGGHWYTKWWAITLGAGVVAGVLIGLIDGEPPPPPGTDTIPYFPSPPTRK
jgi:hypothetical protein